MYFKHEAEFTPQSKAEWSPLPFGAFVNGFVNCVVKTKCKAVSPSAAVLHWSNSNKQEQLSVLEGL